MSGPNALRQFENRILRLIANGASLAETMDALRQEVEALLPDVICSVMTVDSAGLLRPLAAPSRPEEHAVALDGSGGGSAREGHVFAHFALNQNEMSVFNHVDLKVGMMYCGMDLDSVHFTDQGIDVGFATKKCDDSKTPSN